jgi:hypothetical protein
VHVIKDRKKGKKIIKGIIRGKMGKKYFL